MVRIGLIGLGKMGISHLSIAGANSRVTVVAVCDTLKYALDVLKKYSDVSIYTDYRRMIEQEELDAIIVATPSQFHAEAVEAAIAKKLHVFCEKPFCLVPADGRRLAALASSANLVNQVGYHYRFVATFVEMRKRILEGKIGALHHLRAEAYGPVVLRSSNATWRAKKETGGGCLLDYASHAIDLMNFLHEPPRSVKGSSLHSIYSAEVDDEVYSTFQYANGATGQLAVNWSDESFRKMSMKVTAWGEKGKIIADRQELQMYIRGEGSGAGWSTSYTTDLTEEVGFYLRGEEYSAQIEEFISAIESDDKATRSTFASALQTDLIVAAIRADAAQPTSPMRYDMAPPSVSQTSRKSARRFFGR